MFLIEMQLLSRLFRILEIAEADRDLTEEAQVIQHIFVKTLRIVFASGNGPAQSGYKIL
jgi:hypothetical protein